MFTYAERWRTNAKYSNTKRKTKPVWELFDLHETLEINAELQAKILIYVLRMRGIKNSSKCMQPNIHIYVLKHKYNKIKFYFLFLMEIC